MTALMAGIGRALDKGNADNGDARASADPLAVLKSLPGVRGGISQSVFGACCLDAEFWPCCMLSVTFTLL